MGTCSLFHSLSVFCLITIILLPQTWPAKALPLSTNSRWIVDESGQRVKLACVNWVSHLEPVVAEGLSKQPIDTIVGRITSLGFNCVRLTWPLYLATNDSLASLTVRESFQRLGLSQSIAGVQTYNPSIIDLTLIEAFQVLLDYYIYMCYKKNRYVFGSWYLYSSTLSNFFFLKKKKN